MNTSGQKAGLGIIDYFEPASVALLRILGRLLEIWNGHMREISLLFTMTCTILLCSGVNFTAMGLQDDGQLWQTLIGGAGLGLFVSFITTAIQRR